MYTATRGVVLLCISMHTHFLRCIYSLRVFECRIDIEGKHSGVDKGEEYRGEQHVHVQLARVYGIVVDVDVIAAQSSPIAEHDNG